MNVWLNGRLCDERRAVISLSDHGFLYGDGLYETVSVTGRRIELWPAHYARFKRSARALAFSFSWSQAFLAKAILKTVRANGRRAATARLTLSRGAGPLGLDPTRCDKPTLAIQLHPPRNLEFLHREGVVVGIVSVRHSHSEDGQSHKSTSAQCLVQARLEAKKRRLFEGLLLNAQGELTEGTVSNVFFVRNNIVHTPALSCGLLAGVTRAHVLQLARRLRIPVREGRYRAAQLQDAEELFLTNASVRLLPAKTLRIGRVTLRLRGADGPLVRRLQEAWTQSML